MYVARLILHVCFFFIVYKLHMCLRDLQLVPNYRNKYCEISFDSIPCVTFIIKNTDTYLQICTHSPLSIILFYVAISNYNFRT